ncbi:MAG: ABC transporter B family member chloroplastic-like [Trebouxia sp. A1-2]|nr:MAG: ABC transporter B family member chloroplastic-like [Trebouxia sp. A1-2]
MHGVRAIPAAQVLAAASELAIPHYVSASIFAITKANSKTLFKRNVQLLATMAFSYGIFAGLRGFCFSLLNTDLIQRLRGDLFGSLLKQEVAFFDKEEVGVLTSRLGSDCQAVVRALSTNINVALRNALQAIGGAAYLFYLSRRLAAAVAGVTALLWIVALCYGNFSRKAQRTYQDALAETNQATVRTFGTEASEKKRYQSRLGILRHISIRQAGAYLLYLTSNSFLFNLTKVVTLLVGGSMALSGQVNPEQLTTFVLYVEFVTAASLSVCDQWGPLMEAIGASERVMYYLDKPPAPQIAAGRIVPSWSGKVDLTNIGFAYPTRSDIVALQDVTFKLEPGKLVALVGLSGSGKSTLVALLQRLYDPNSGQVLLDGVPLTEVDASWYRGQIGVVAQDPRLFSNTITANITYGCTHKTQEEVQQAAKLANAHDFILALPDGYATKVRDGLLSGGQRQRIALARALVRDPKLLILDEATSALDAKSEAAVQEALDRAMQNSHRSVLVIAHRLSTVRSADHTIVMEAGRIVEQGTHDSLLAEGKIYATLVRRQAGGAGEQAHLSDSNKTAVAGLQTPSADGSEAQSSLGLSSTPGFDTPEAANAWFGHNPQDKRSGGMEVVDEKVLAAATLPQHIVQQIEVDARPKSPLLSSMEGSVDVDDLGPIDMPEQSGKLKAQKYRKGE